MVTPLVSEYLVEAGKNQILDGIDEIPILVVYPRNRNRNPLMSLILSEAPGTVYFYALSDEDETLKLMLANLVEQAQFPHDFGNETRNALDNSSDPRDWAVAFASDLSKLRSDAFILTLDELDRLKPDLQNLDAFFRALAPNLPSQAQIMVNGREMFRQPWNDLILDGFAVAVGDQNAVKSGIFTESADRGQVEFQSISGQSGIRSDGRYIRSWDGTLPRNLCYYFIDHHMVTRDEIFDIFWPHLGVKEATNVFHVTKRKISEKIGYEITAYSNGFYVPSPRVNVLYDAREFETQIEEAISGPEELAPAKWYRAVQLYRHPYLEGVDMDWVVEKREQLRNGFASALIGLGRLHSRLNETDRALGYFLRAAAEKPDREDVHRNIMQLYSELDRTKEIVAQYKTLESVLKRKLGITPSQETRALYEVLTK